MLCDFLRHLKAPRKKLVSFVTMSHFLEHLSSVNEAEAFLVRGIDVSRHSVFIRQPWFDSDGELLQLGLKFYWSDWTGHPNKMTSLDFYKLLKKQLDKGAIRGFEIYGDVSIADSSHPAIIPLDSPQDQHSYDEKKHGKKEMGVTLESAAYKEIAVFVDVDGGSDRPRFLRLMKDPVSIIKVYR